MSRLFKLASIPVLAIGLAFITSGAQADAGGFSFSIGNHGYRSYGVRSGHGYRSAYYGRSYRPSYNYSRVYGSHYGGYHQPRGGHYDYHAPTLVPHGNHLDYVPGHYDYHRGGHYGH